MSRERRHILCVGLDLGLPTGVHADSPEQRRLGAPTTILQRLSAG